jgi:hypothetical protein
MEILMENTNPLAAYDRRKHLQWFEQEHPGALEWPPEPRDDDEAARYIAAYTAPPARSRACPLCGTPAGEPCQPKPAADHLARLLDAYMCGKLTRAHLVAVVDGLTVIDESAVIGEAEMPPRLDDLLSRGLEVSFVKDPEGIVALVDDHAAGVHTGIGGTAADALEAAVAGLDEQ